MEQNSRNCSEEGSMSRWTKGVDLLRKKRRIELGEVMVS